MLTLGSGMQPRNLVFITVLTLCHQLLGAQSLTNVAPPSAPHKLAKQEASASAIPPAASATTYDGPTLNHPSFDDPLPDDPGQEILPVAHPEPIPQAGTPVRWEAADQTWAGNTLTLTGDVVFHYRDYILQADKVVYHRDTSEVEAEGNLLLTGGPYDLRINSSRGEMRLNMHTARFYNVSGSQGIRNLGRTVVYSNANPFLFSARVFLQLGEGSYRLVDGSMTNCRLPHPDWRIISRSIAMADGKASTRNSIFEFLNIPIFYLPYLRHPIDQTGRESGLLIPVLSNSSIKGFIVGEQYYWVINHSMDMIVGAEYYSKRGWAPNGDFRFKGAGLNQLTMRWNALLDRGVEQQVGSTLTSTTAHREDVLPGPTGFELVNQGGVDVVALGRKDFNENTRVAGTAEYLSNYIYRLVFNDNYTQAVSSDVASDLAFTHNHNGFIPSVTLDRFETYASSTNGDEARILHLPSVRYDVLNRPIGDSPFYWSAGSSAAYISRSEPHLHARNVGRFDFYPHLSMPFLFDGWSVVPEVALRDTFYTVSQIPDLTGARSGTPSISRDALNRADVEASLTVRPPAIERDFDFGGLVLRHVIEPELFYHFVGGIGAQARNVPLIDTTDIATNTDEIGYSLTQRFYRRNTQQKPCDSEYPDTPDNCSQQAPREWASWQISQKYFFDPNFGGALIPDRRNVFDTTLDLTAVAFLTSARNLSPVVSRLRFEAISNLRVEWDLDYDPKAGRLQSDNIFAGYSWGRTTVGVGHTLLDAVDENGSSASNIQNQQVQPFLFIGKQNSLGFNLAANAGYDLVQNSIQYAGIQAVYNWNCCGLTLGYRRFQLGSVRDETQYLYSFTIANFGSVGDIRRSNTVFRDPTLPSLY
jgi:LPS-assembly protein